MDNFKIAESVFNTIIEALNDADVAPGVTGKFWTDGEKILSKDERGVNGIADLLDDIAGFGICSGGYYDPEEDKRTGCTDQYTGYHYIELAE